MGAKGDRRRPLTLGEAPGVEVDLLRRFRAGLDARIVGLSAAYPLDPVEFARKTLGVDLWAKQAEIARAVASERRVAVRSCHGAGKTFLASVLALWFLHTRPNSVVLTTAPTDRQVRNVLWREIRTRARAPRQPLKGRSLIVRYEIAEDWYGLGFKASETDPNAFQGFHSEHVLVIIDESAGVPDAVEESLDPAMSSEDAHMLIIGNPTSFEGFFREAFHRNRAMYRTFKIAAEDTPNFTAGEVVNPKLITPRYVEEVVQKNGADSDYVRSRINAEFPKQGSAGFVPLAWIEAAQARERPEHDASTPLVAGLDVARTGSDKTVLTLRRGHELLEQIAWTGADTMVSVGMCLGAFEEFGFTEEHELRVDVVGLGSGVADRLAELGYRVIEINSGAGSSDPEQWPRLRHELWWQAYEGFRDGRYAGAFHEDLMAELSAVRAKYDSSHTKPVIEPKDKTAERIGHSPDYADSFVYAFGMLPRRGPRRERSVVAMRSAKSRWAGGTR